MSARWYRVLCVLVVLSMLVSTAGCGGGRTPEITAVPTIAPPTLVPTRTPAPVPTSAPTEVPLPPVPPRVLGTAPARGEELRVDQPLVLRFDQPMNPASVEQAFRLEPQVPGKLVWEDETTLQFVPEQPLERDADYTVTLAEGIASAAGLAAGQSFTFRFRTVGTLQVTDVFPLPGSTDVPTDGTVRVFFNRPVTPLTYVRDQANLPDPLRFDPPVAGEGEWTNTSVYAFQPDEPLAPGSTYTVTVPAGLTDTTGGLLEADYTWSFTTELPRIVAVTPEDGARHVPPAAAVRIAFSQAMDASATEALVRLLDESGQPVAGEFTWEGNTLVLQPLAPLAMGEIYYVEVEPGAPAASGQAVAPEGWSSTFTVLAEPRVVLFTPEGDQVDPGLGLQITFSAPMSTATFLDGLVITPEAHGEAYWREDDTIVYVSTYLQPSTAYTVTITTDVLAATGQPLVEEATFSFRTRAYEPSFYLDPPDQVAAYNAYGSPSALLHAVNVERLNLELYTVAPEEFLGVTSSDGWQRWQNFQPGTSALVREWTVLPDAPLNEEALETIPFTHADGSALEPGLYFLRATSPQVRGSGRYLLVVTRLNVTIKSTSTETLVWVTDLQSGLPVPGAALSVYGDLRGLIATGTTDEDGLLAVTHEEQDIWGPRSVLVQEGDALTAHLKDWQRGIAPWDYRLSYDPYVQAYRTMLYTDRAIYRPGQTVYYKAVIRRDEDGVYSLPPIGDAAVATATLTDSEGRALMTAEIPVSDMGTADGSIPLDAEAATGYYRLAIEYAGGHYDTYFSVAEYRKPEFEVTVALDAEEYVQGDEIAVDAVASYYFGGAVANAPVHWSVIQSPWTFDRWEGEGYYSFTEYDWESRGETSWGGQVAEGQGTTDAQGRFHLVLPADIAEETASQTWSIEVTVTDVNNQAVSNSAGAILHKGTLYIGVAARSYVGTVGEPQEIALLTVDTTGAPRGGQRVTATLLLREWLSVREMADDGRYYWTNSLRETAVATQTVTTDAEGLGTATFRPEQGGSYRVRAIARDEQGNEVRSAAYLWVSDRAYVHWGRESTDAIDLIADKDIYAPGETATILVPSPFEGEVQALLTIERGAVLEHRVITLQSNSEQLRIPVTAAYAPNVYVSVVIVQGMTDASAVPNQAVGYVELPVSTVEQQLQIAITPEREGTFQPREEATFDLAVTDHRGRGVEAELSVKLVDRAVEALTGGDTTDIVDAFYRRRALGVATGSTMSVLADRILLVVRQEGKGGGGGAEAAGPLVRSEFADTAYWSAAVRTDADGHATVTIPLPDNLTTWHLAVQGVTAETLVGAGDAYIVSTLDLMIRPVAPRFLVTGDAPALGAVVHNNTARDVSVTANLTAEGVTVEGGAQTLTVAARSVATVSWPAQAGAVDSATLHYTASGGGLQDAIDITLPVYHATSPEVVGTAGQVEDSILELVRLPASADPTLGGLTLYLEPSLAAGLQDSLTFLRSYPYECVEQTVSRFLPNVATYRALQSLGIERPDLAAVLPDLVSRSLQRLYRAQDLDGGWGWWPGRESSALITSYVVLGMVEARAADLAVDADSLARGIGFLQGWLEWTPADDSTADLRAAVLYSLAEAGAGDLGRSVALYDESRYDLSTYAQAYLAMTLQLLEPDEPARVTDLVNEFANAAVTSATGTHWEEGEEQSRWMNTDRRTTALVLRALLRVSPDSAMLPNAVRWLMSVRQDGHWATTQENAWAIMALTDYMVHTGELEGNYAYTVTVNGRERAAGQVTPETVDQVVTTTVPAAELRRLGDNQLLLERSAGPGRLYYSTFLKYFLPADEMRALNRGLIVTREYLTSSGALGEPVTAAQAADEFTVRLTVIAPHDVSYLVVEDPLPAGCEAVDVSLAITSQAPTEEEGAEAAAAWNWEDWWFRGGWTSHTEIRDEKVVLFADFLGAGTYEYTYRIRATTPGAYQVLPATAYEMYFPDVFGRSDGAVFRISD